MFWISKIFQLAVDWQLNLDNLRTHQVVSLYAKGHDQLAEEVRSSPIYFTLKTKSIHNFFVFNRLYLLSITKKTL